MRSSSFLGYMRRYVGAGGTPIKPPEGERAGELGDLLLPTRDLRLVGVDEERLAVAGDGAVVDHHLLDVGERRQVEHDVEQRVLDDGAQPAGSRAALERALG